MKQCQVCQYHRKLIRRPPKPLQTTHPFVSICSLDIDTIGQFDKGVGRGYKNILAIIDYISKWARLSQSSYNVYRLKLY